jgi:hypothetical protein
MTFEGLAASGNNELQYQNMWCLRNVSNEYAMAMGARKKRERRQDIWIATSTVGPASGCSRERLFCGRLSQMENIYKIYAKSFRSEAYLEAIVPKHTRP